MNTGARSLDTTDEAAEVQREVWRRLGPEGRVLQVIEMSDSMHRIVMAGIAERHPELDQRGVVRRYIANVHGIDVDTSK